LEKFVKNPVCKASDRQYTKRDGGEKTVALAKRHDLAASDWSGLMLQISALAIGRAGTYQSSLMAGQFNTTYGEPFGLSLDQIHRSFDDA
jgi:chitinase